ncbi:hypothetical protein [Candidatus Chloroploca sp. Khr17]|uniref:hypothetical protein n=1 Tax=Candidatus Chloroploca sp. Khr17 TaxID=2496869 RepID=UPI00101C6052|nr:hypothetical protein [Candidatus Chloroploca sp. Khr17]
MADWRYEGVICGYLSLYGATGAKRWLARARAAGDDLVAALLPSGKFRNSSFQQGPMEGGTPHEAAADVGLLELARVLRAEGDPSWAGYFEAARSNIRAYLLGELWSSKGFLDQPWNTALVPNKNATTIEALVLYEELSGEDMSPYLGPAVGVILGAQERSGPRAGATIHIGTGRHRLAIGIYTARSICGLLRLYERGSQDELLDAVHRALGFLRGLVTAEGVYFGRYPDGSLIVNPLIVAGAGDMLRATFWGRRYGLAADADVSALAAMLLRAQQPAGGLPFGYGMARRGGRQPYQGLPEFRDVLPAVGWCDKAFRALALLIEPGPDLSLDQSFQETQIECVWQGRRFEYFESAKTIALTSVMTGRSIYLWSKGTCYPSIYQL